MKRFGFVFIILLTLLFAACTGEEVYNNFSNLPEEGWSTQQPAEFDFIIANDTLTYQLYCRIRNESDYKFSRLFTTFQLYDSTGRELQNKLLELTLFEPKTGVPRGRSGLGDIYDHEQLALNQFKFPYQGKFSVRFTQMMRVDTLSGVRAVGLKIVPVTKP